MSYASKILAEIEVDTLKATVKGLQAEIVEHNRIRDYHRQEVKYKQDQIVKCNAKIRKLARERQD